MLMIMLMRLMVGTTEMAIVICDVTGSGEGHNRLINVAFSPEKSGIRFGGKYLHQEWNVQQRLVCVCGGGCVWGLGIGWRRWRDYWR